LQPLTKSMRTMVNHDQNNIFVERQAQIYVDVNIPSGVERIVVYEGDKAEDLASEFARKHGLDRDTEEKLVQMLQKQIDDQLEKIDEEHDSNSEA